MDGTFMKRPWPADSFVFDFTDEIVRLWKGQTQLFWGGFGERFMTNDRATRARYCIVDKGNDTVTITQQRDTSTYKRTVNTSFPTPYRVVFSAQNYNAGKDGTASNQTWHWDDILVSAS